ncbi:MAG: hypothetical protein ACUVWK_06890 [Nitrososphaerales archaeon]
MPVPLNAFLEVTKIWLMKRLGYHIDDTVPFKLEGCRTPSDIDIVGTHPSNSKVYPELLGIPPFEKNIIVECKGWIDYKQATYDVLRYLDEDLNLMGSNYFISKTSSEKKDSMR